MKKGNGQLHTGCPFPFLFSLYACLAIPGFSVLYEHHVCLPLFLRECLAHQPRAEHVRMVGVQPEGDGDDDFKRIHVRVTARFQAACSDTPRSRSARPACGRL